MAVIDLRDDPRLGMAMAQNLGGNIGAALGYRQRQRRRNELQAGIVRILQRRAADPENYTEDQALADMVGLRGIVDERLSQQTQEAIGAATGTGRYYQHPLTRAGGHDAIYARGQTIKNRAIRDKQAYITIEKQFGREPDPKVLAGYDRQAAVGQSMMDRYPLGAATPESAPPALVSSMSGLDANALGLQAQYPSLQAQYPSVFKQPQTGIPKNKDEKEQAKAQPAAGEETIGPPMPPGFVNRNWFQGAENQPGEFAKAATPKQTKTDAAIAKEISPQAPAGLAEIWNEMTEAEKQSATELLSKGAAAEQIIAHFKNKTTGK